MKTARIVRLAALKRQVELQKWMVEAGKLNAEIERLNQRIVQVDSLKEAYAAQMRERGLTASELIGLRVVDHNLNSRREIDVNRRELLENERRTIAAMLAGKKSQVDTLKNEAKTLKRAEAEEKLEKLQALMPSRRI
jgi:hypothetical protein